MYVIYIDSYCFQPELEEFIPFMVKCSLGRGVSGHRDLSNCTTPEWWPKEEFPFSFPLHGPNARHPVSFQYYHSIFSILTQVKIENIKLLKRILFTG